MIYRINAIVYYDAASLKKYGKLCLECVDRAWKVYAFVMLAIVASVASALIGPIYVFIKANQRSSLFELKIPFLVNDPDWELVVNGVLQTISGIFVMLGNLGLEGIMILSLNSLDISTNISSHQNNEFSLKLITKTAVAKEEIKYRVLRMCHQIEKIDG